MRLYCINNWVKDPACCLGEQGSNLFMGIKVVSNANTFWHRAPFQAKISNGKLRIREYDGVSREWKDKTYYTADFSQTVAELKDILLRCSTGQYDNSLVKKEILFYTVDAGDQQTFLCPKEADETYLPIEYYEVFLDDDLLETGTGAFEYILDGGDVFFTVAIPDLTDDVEPSDAYVIKISYWVKK